MVDYTRSFSPVLLLIAIVVVACGEKPQAEGCGPNITPTGKTERSPHPISPSSCGVLLMTENLCKYDAEGRFVDVESNITGICLGSSF